MVKTTIEQKGNKYVVMNRLTYPETINEREYKAITDGLVEGLIPVHTEKSKSGVVMKSTMVGMMSLQSYFNGVVSKDMFLDVTTQIIAIVKECEKNLLNINNLQLDCEHIFLDRQTKKIKCTFWPIINNQNPFVWSEFFQDLPFHAVFTKDENHDYVPRYLGYFKNNIPLSINSFERLIFALKENRLLGPTDSTELGNLQISTILEESKGNTASTSTGYNMFNRKREKSKYCPKCGNEYGDSANYCSSCGSLINGDEDSQIKFLDISEVLGIKVKQSTSETTLLGTEEFDGGTTVLGADLLEEPTIPYLIREKTEEKILLNKPVFRIGKDSKICDYFVSNNNAVSRSHADIISKDHRYYVIDNNSTNKTYVDSRAIPGNKEIEIFSGTKLRLANEDFVFYI